MGICSPLNQGICTTGLPPRLLLIILAERILGMNLYHRFFSKYAVGIQGGRAISLKGKMTNSKLRELENICREEGVESGEIWSNGLDQVSFSREIPNAIQQRLRNSIFEIWR